MDAIPEAVLRNFFARTGKKFDEELAETQRDFLQCPDTNMISDVVANFVEEIARESLEQANAFVKLLEESPVLGPRWQSAFRQAAIDCMCEGYKRLAAPEDWPPPTPEKLAEIAARNLKEMKRLISVNSRLFPKSTVWQALIEFDEECALADIVAILDQYDVKKEHEGHTLSPLGRINILLEMLDKEFLKNDAN